MINFVFREPKFEDKLPIEIIKISNLQTQEKRCNKVLKIAIKQEEGKAFRNKTL